MHRPALKIVLLLSGSLTVMAASIISPTLPLIQNTFAHEANSELYTRLVLTLPALFIALFAPIAGYLSDHMGRKNVLVASMVVYALSGVSAVFLNSLWSILITRAVLGTAVAGIMTANTTLISDYFDSSLRSKFMGLQASFMAIGGIVFISLSGLLSEFSWRYPFILYTAGIILALPAFRILYEPGQNLHKHTELPSLTSSSFRFVLLRIYLLLFFLMIVFYLIPVQLPFLLKVKTGCGSREIGAAMALFFTAGALTSIMYYKVKRLLSYELIFILSFFLMSVGYFFIYVADTYGMMIMALIPAGLGMGTVIPNSTLWTSITVPGELRGRAMGGLTTAMFLGQFLSPLFFQPLLGRSSLGFLFAAGALLLLVLIAALGVHLLIKRLTG